MTDRDGGPAFARPDAVYETGYGISGEQGHPGMTLRQYYRAHAPVTVEHAVEVWRMSLFGYVDQPNEEDVDTPEKWADVWRTLARLCDGYATAMLALDGEKKDG